MQSYQVGSVVVDRYEIKEILGQGPVGTTYLAFDQEVEVDVALKILAEELFVSEGARQDFVAAMEAVREVSHPNLRKFYEAETVDNLVFYTGAYHAGETLKQALQGRKSFTHLEAEPILSQLCQALHHAERRFAHGGVRPENILVLPDSVKVTDLGLASALSFGTYTATLKKGSTSRYLAPEVRRGGAPLGPHVDVYSLGVLFYEMLTGEPYEGGNSSLLAKNPVLPPAFDEVLKYSLAQDPEQRYNSAEEFSEDIASVIDTGKIRPRETTSRSVPAQPMQSSLPSASTPESTEALAPKEKAPEPDPSPLGSFAKEPQGPSPIEVTGSAIIEEIKPPAPDAYAEVVSPDVSRIETVIPEEPLAAEKTPEVTDDEATGVVAAPVREEAEDLESAETVVRAAPSSRPTSSPEVSLKDPGDDLFDVALRDVREEPRPAEKAETRPTTSKEPARTRPGLDLTAKDSTPPARPEAALPASTSTELARSSDLPPPVAPPAQSAVIMPGWFAGVLGLGILALIGVVIYLLLQPPPPTYGVPPYPQTLAAVNDPPETSSTTLEVPPVASTQAATEPASTSSPTTLLATSDPTTSATTLSVGVDPTTLQNPTTDPVTPTPPEPKKETVCPGGTRKLTYGREKVEFCIDRYEYPNARGRAPQTGVDFATAESTCASKGKRLCTAQEWGRACGGAFPYGKAFDPESCNTKDANGNSRAVAASGSFAKCKRSGVYDLSGNVDEWIAGKVKRGGSARSSEMFASCSKSSRGGASEFTGFRCCADPKEAP